MHRSIVRPFHHLKLTTTSGFLVIPAARLIALTPVANPESPYSNNFIVQGAGGVVFDAKGMVLVLGHLDGTWVFPKGHLESGESLLAAALREVKEEAGVTAICPNPARFGVTRYVNNNGKRRMITYYRMTTEAIQPVLRESTFPKGNFLPVNQALRKLSFTEDRDLLRELE